jgi:hypothetical protein
VAQVQNPSSERSRICAQIFGKVDCLGYQSQHSSHPCSPSDYTVLEPAQDILGVGIGLALFGLMIRTIAWLLLRIFRPALDFRQRIAEVLFMLAS